MVVRSLVALWLALALGLAAAADAVVRLVVVDAVVRLVVVDAVVRLVVVDVVVRLVVVVGMRRSND